jgi:hypothetical protein
MERTHRIGWEGSLAETTYFCNDKEPHSSTDWKALFGFECTNSRSPCRTQKRGSSLVILAFFLLWCDWVTAESHPSPTEKPELNDSHFHLTNYIQVGTDIHDFLNIMGTKVGRVALFGIPAQNQLTNLGSSTLEVILYCLWHS